jgi:hypothetical protein
MHGGEWCSSIFSRYKMVVRSIDEGRPSNYKYIPMMMQRKMVVFLRSRGDILSQ